MSNSDLDIPMASLVRLVKQTLPADVTIAKETRLALQKSTRVFISYVTAMAQAQAAQERRSVIQAKDVLVGVRSFPGLEDILVTALEKEQSRAAAVREAKEKSGLVMTRKRIREDDDAVDVEEEEVLAEEEGSDDANADADADATEPPPKKSALVTDSEAARSFDF
jgi:DNA polymerase epsilon subunit 3